MSMCQHCGALPNEWHPSWCPNSGTTPTARPETTQVSETPGDGRNEAGAPPVGGRAVALATLEVYYCGDGKGGKAIPTREALNLPAGHYSLYASPPSPSGAAGLLAEAKAAFDKSGLTNGEWPAFRFGWLARGEL